MDLATLKTPTPIACRSARQIHACYRTQVQQILQRYDGIVSDRRPGRANQIPGNIVAITGQVTACEILRVMGLGAKPSLGGVVIMGTAVNDRVALIIVRKEAIFRIAVEGELQDAHAG